MQFTTPKRILVPTDFSACSRAALEYALMLRGTGGVIELLHVKTPDHNFPETAFVPVPGGSPMSLPEFHWRSVNEELERLAGDLRRRGITNVHTRIESGEAPEKIVHVAAEDFDMIVMGTNGRTGFARFVAGSVAERVVRTAPCPVLTLRVPEEPAQLVAEPVTGLA